MRRTRQKYIRILIICAAGILLATLREKMPSLFILPKKPVVYLGICVFWGLSLRRRIIPYTMRHMLVTGAFLLGFLFVVQTLRYENPMAEEYAVSVYLWYLYYVPLIMIPLFSFYSSMCVGEEPDSDPIRRWLWLMILAVALCILVFTNNSHQWVFRFAERIGLEPYTHGFMYYVIVVWIVLWFAASIWNFFRKCTVASRKKYVWVPMAVLGLEVLYSILNVTGVLNHVKIIDLIGLKFQEVFCLTVIIYFESCINLGFIPSNNGYEELFTYSAVNASIADENKDVIYYSPKQRILSDEEMEQANTAPLYLDENTVVRSHKIHGGRVYWSDDLSSLNQIQKALTKLRDRLLDDNELLNAQNQIIEQQTQYATKNRLYDTIAEIVTPDAQKISKILRKKPKDRNDLENRLMRATVYGIFIKRRVNLELIHDRSEKISVKELYLSVKEALDNLTFMNIHSYIEMDRDRVLSGENLIGVYEFFEQVILKYLPEIQVIMVHVPKKESFEFTVELGNRDAWDVIPEEELRHFPGNVTVTAEDNTLMYRLEIPEEGVIA